LFVLHDTLSICLLVCESLSALDATMCAFTVTWDPLQLHYMSLRSHCHSLVSRSQAYITHGHHSFVTIYLSFLTGRQATFRTLRGKRCSTSETCIYAIKFSNHFVATMGPSLRKRISKLTTEPPEDKVSSIASSSSIFLAAVDHLRTPNTLSKDNMASTPPPLLAIQVSTAPVQRSRC
jgi:hypothetical protein